MNFKNWHIGLRFFLFGCIVLTLGACTARLKEPLMPQQAFINPPQIFVDPVTGEHFIEIDILIYNVAGLPWPISSNRGKALKLIGAEFAAMRRRGVEPDIVLIQEGFIAGIKDLIKLSGYPNWARGPKATDRAPDFSDRASEKFKNSRSFWKGERTGKLMDSGLYILSNFPMINKVSRPFYRFECAGYDCGSNKGVMGVDLKIPGMPGHLGVFNTHFNSRGSSTGVSEERAYEAHQLQLQYADEILDENWERQYPVIFGGDFNVKQARDTLDYMIGTRVKRLEKPAIIVPHYCTVIDTSCDFRVPYNSDEPWIETHNWQGWYPGEIIKTKAIMVDEMFDKPHPQAPKIDGDYLLSDHSGVRVRYRLSWTPKKGKTSQ